MQDITLTDLARVTGGLNMAGARESTNVEDRRGWSAEKSLNAPISKPPPIVQSPRTPGDLPSQLGIDSIGKSPRGGGSSAPTSFGGLGF